MSVSVIGNGGTVAEVATNTLALRTEPRPLDVGAYGSYQVGVVSGVMAAGIAANANIFSFRWASAAALALIRQIRIQAWIGTTAFVAGNGNFALFAARSFSASDTGGTAPTLTTNNAKLKTAFATTQISAASGDLRASTTAALSAGTRVLDAAALAQCGFPISTVADVIILPWQDLFFPGPHGQPLSLAQNEGFVIQTNMPGTGTWGFAIDVAWDEYIINAGF